MHRVVLVALLASTCGCYLFSDEPKARKKPGLASSTDPAKPEPGEEQTSAPGPEAGAAEGSAGTQTDGCPAFLTGIESGARTIASNCESVRVRGQYRIEGGSLRIEAGVELRFEAGAALEVGRDRAATLIVAGTREQPVRMIADADEAGAGWAGLRLHPGADGSTLEHLELSGAGTEERGALFIAAPAITAEGLRIQNSRKLALELSVPGAKLLATTLEGEGVIARSGPTAAAGLLDLHLDPGASIAIDAGEIQTPIEWPRNAYRIEGVLRIAGDADVERPAQLSLAPGVELGFGPAGRVVVGGLGPGVLTASTSPMPSLLGGPALPPPGPGEAPDDDGSLGDMIIMRAAGNGQPGAWAGIHVQDRGQLILRNVEISYGGSRDEGVVLADKGATLSLEGCQLRHNLVGIELRGAEVEIETLANNEFISTPVALRTVPALIEAANIPGNRFSPGTQIQIERGRVESDSTWVATEVDFLVRGDVFVDKGARLTLPAGSHLSFGPGVVLGVGYYETATLDMRGRADALIELGPLAPLGPAGPDPSLSLPWGGVVLGHHASKVRFEHVTLTQTANAAAIELRDGADATLVTVDCRDCAGATVQWDCESTVGNIGVSASGTTPTALISPSDCK